MNDGYVPTTARVHVWRTQHGEQLLRLYVQSEGSVLIYIYILFFANLFHSKGPFVRKEIKAD